MPVKEKIKEIFKRKQRPKVLKSKETVEEINAAAQTALKERKKRDAAAYRSLFVGRPVAKPKTKRNPFLRK